MNNNHLKTIAAAALLTLTLPMSGCGGGDSPPPPPPPCEDGDCPPPPTGTAPDNPIVYITTDDAFNEIGAIYLVDPATPGESVQVNSPLVAGGQLGFFSLSPDLSQVAYLAFQDTATEGELYLVDLAEPGTSTKLNGPMTAGGFVDEFVFSPDGSRIAYIADQDVFDQFELYLVDLATPGVSTRLNPDLPENGQVSSRLSFSSDGSMVLYSADLDVEGQFELYLVDLAAPGVANKVNGPFVTDGDLFGDYRFSPDGETIVYMADQDVDGVRELYAVDVDNLGVSTKLNPSLVADGDLCTFQFSPDSTKVAYCADQDTDGTLELYIVDLAVPGVSSKVNPTLVAGGEVQSGSFRFGPDSDFIVYNADQDVDGDNELYRVEVATPGVSAKLNEPLPAGGDVSIFQIRPDGLQLTYVADQDTEGLDELYNVDLSTPGASTKLNPPRQGSLVFHLEITEDGLQVLYIADQDTTETYELYRVDIASAGVATTISSALPVDDANSDVVFFATAAENQPAMEGPAPEPTASFAEIQDTILTPTCAVSGCHTGANPPDGLNLSAGEAYSNIVDIASVQMPDLFRIEPGDPDNSYLIRKVEGSGIVANRMPLNDDPLTEDQIDLLRQWVSDGAEDN